MPRSRGAHEAAAACQPRPAPMPPGPGLPTPRPVPAKRGLWPAGAAPPLRPGECTRGHCARFASARRAGCPAARCQSEPSARPRCGATCAW
eukprot:5303359-Lingulodinium_polyedra.AAC.1